MSHRPLRALAIASVLAIGMMLQLVMPAAATSEAVVLGSQPIDVTVTAAEPPPADPSGTQDDPAPDVSPDPQAPGLDPPTVPAPIDVELNPQPPDPSAPAAPPDDSAPSAEPILEPEIPESPILEPEIPESAIPEPVEDPATGPSPMPEPIGTPAPLEPPADSEMEQPLALDQATALRLVADPEDDEVGARATADAQVTTVATVAPSVAGSTTLPAPTSVQANGLPAVPVPAESVHSAGGIDAASQSVAQAGMEAEHAGPLGARTVKLIDDLEQLSAGAIAGLVASNRAPSTAVAVALEFGRAGSGWAGAIVFNLWLRRQLRVRRMSQRQLAALSGVDHSTISRILKQDRRPSLATATMLARALRQVEGESDAADYFERLPEETLFPARRVEMALRADELLQDSDVRRLMTVYLEARRRRQGAPAVSTPPRAVPSPGSTPGGGRRKP